MKKEYESSLIKSHCELFGEFGFVVQFVLAILSFTSLVGIILC